MLVDEGGLVLEGTQSNFFVVIDGEVWTADETMVLGGTIREIVIRVCKQENILFRLHPPHIASHRYGTSMIKFEY